MKYAELEQYARDTRARADRTQGEVDILHRGVTDLDRRAKAAAGKVEKVEKDAAEVKKKVAKAEVDIGKAAKDAVKFSADLGARLGRLGRLLGSEGFQRFTEGFDLGEDAQDLQRALGVAGDAAAGAARLGGILPIVGAAAGGVIGGALGSTRENERRRGLANQIGVRSDQARFRQRVEAIRAEEQARRAGATALASAQAAQADAERQSAVGRDFLAQAQDRDAALRRARGTR